ncbi:MAG: hypothetical protein ABIK61_04200 [candidate division WOR-3 bacterium]
MNNNPKSKIVRSKIPKNLKKRYDLIIDLVKNQKYTAIEVARRLGLSRQRIGQILHKLGIATPRMKKVKFGNPLHRYCSICGGEKSTYAYICRKCYDKKIANFPKKVFYCPICGKPKSSKTGHRCWQCFIKSVPRVTLTCETCGKKFKILQSIVNIRKRMGRPRRFCSRKCFMEWWKSPNKKLASGEKE